MSVVEAVVQKFKKDNIVVTTPTDMMQESTTNDDLFKEDRNFLKDASQVSTDISTLGRVVLTAIWNFEHRTNLLNFAFAMQSSANSEYGRWAQLAQQLSASDDGPFSGDLKNEEDVLKIEAPTLLNEPKPKAKLFFGGQDFVSLDDDDNVAMYDDDEDDFSDVRLVKDTVSTLLMGNESISYLTREALEFATAFVRDSDEKQLMKPERVGERIDQVEIALSTGSHNIFAHSYDGVVEGDEGGSDPRPARVFFYKNTFGGAVESIPTSVSRHSDLQAALRRMIIMGADSVFRSVSYTKDISSLDAGLTAQQKKYLATLTASELSGQPGIIAKVHAALGSDAASAVGSMSTSNLAEAAETLKAFDALVEPLLAELRQRKAELKQMKNGFVSMYFNPLNLSDDRGVTAAGRAALEQGEGPRTRIAAYVTPGAISILIMALQSCIVCISLLRARGALLSRDNDSVFEYSAKTIYEIEEEAADESARV